MAGLDDLLAGSATPGAPAFQPTQPAMAADPSGFGTILAQLRGAGNNIPNPYGQNTATQSLGGGLPDVRGKTPGNALMAGIAQGMQARQQAAAAAAANQLAQMKMLWEHQDNLAKNKVAQQNADQQGAYYKSLGAQADANAKKALAEANSPGSKDKSANVKTLHDFATDLQTKTGWDPGAPWFQKLPQQEQDARRDMFTSNFKAQTGVDYPNGKDGQPLPPPSLMSTFDPLSSARKSPFAAPKDDKPSFLGGIFGGSPAPAATATPAATPDAATPDATPATPAAPAAAPAPEPGTWRKITNPKTGASMLWNDTTGATKPFDAGAVDPAQSATPTGPATPPEDSEQD